MSIKDVARVMDLPLAESNALAKLVPDRPGTSLRKVLKAPLTGPKSLNEEGVGADDIDNIKKLREIYNGEDMRSKVLHEAEILEGSVRNTGIHASAIIIAPQDLMDLIPVASSKDSDLWLTQIDGSNIESAGVLKMDFLGLKTLSILKTALQLIEQNHGVIIDLDTLPLDDEETYKLYQRADTNATFQFESGGMQKYLRDLKPDKFNDLIAMNALFRPGPMAYIPDYIERKHGRQEIHYDLPGMEEILKDTYGITVYQEQVMLLSQKLAGFSKGDADVLRKAMGKKQRAVLDKMKAQFLEGAKNNKHPEDKLEKIWTDWESFAQYAFNKSHSTCYALVAYQTAWLKAHYPSEYMAAVLNHAGSIEKITFYMEECKRMGLTVLGPDINESQKGFAVNKKGEIRFGFSGMKGVGEAALENIIEEREKRGAFGSIYDLIKRVSQRTVNKKSLESLAYAGAFDCFKNIHRAQYFFTGPGDTINGLEKIIRFGNQYQAQLSSNTNTLFGDLQMAEVLAPSLPECEPWTLVKLLDYEKDVTGMFLSGHPLDNFSFALKYYRLTTIAEFNEFKEAVNLHPNPGKPFRIAGLVTEAQHRVAKSGNNYGVFHIEDYTSKMELMLFSDDYVKFSNYLEPGMVISLSGTFRQRYNKSEFEFKVAQISLLESVMRSCTKRLQIETEPKNISKELIDFMNENVGRFPGKSSLKFCVNDITSKLKFSMYSLEKGFEMNDEMANYLLQKPELVVQVELT
jgi:DNA polymerase-3 subunit alpha